MEQLSSIKEELHELWLLPKEERDDILHRIQAYATASDYNALVEEVRASFEMEEESGIADIYLALSEVEDNDRWSKFFVEEFHRAFELAKTHPKPQDVLNCLEAIDFSDEAMESRIDEVAGLLQEHLQSGRPAVRFKAIQFLSDWIWEEDVPRYSHIIQQVKTILQQDEHWLVRLEAADFLEMVKRLPSDYQPSFWDKIRRRFFSPGWG